MTDTDRKFNTILSTNRYVKKFQATKYKAEKKKVEKKMPETFNPIEKWGYFLSNVRNQGKCGACWAMATSKALSDRYAILSRGAIVDDFSSYQMIMCQGTIFPSIPLDDNAISRINLEAHTEGACNGNSLFTAMDFMYSVGLVSTKCINQGLFKNYDIPDITTITDPESVPLCQSVLGQDYSQCLDRSVAPRYYRTIAGYQVDSDVESIKQEIYKWGPVVSGFQVYKDFLDEYDGTTIYMGPKEGSKGQGGHAIEILGWGKENGVDFWWICNSWGVDWGLGGYFKMKMNIKECELEKNVVSFIPDFPGFKKDMIDYQLSTSPDLIALREYMRVDPINGYKDTSIIEIKNGEMKGDLTPIFNKDNIPDMTTTWLGEMSEDETSFYQSVPIYQNNKNYFMIFVKSISFIILLAAFFFIGKRIRLLIKKKK